MDLIWVICYDLHTKFPFPNTLGGDKLACHLAKLMKLYRVSETIEIIYPKRYNFDW